MHTLRAGTPVAGSSRKFVVVILPVVALVTLTAVARAVRPSYASSELRAAVETAQALIAFLITHLFYGRFQRTRSVGDWLIAYGTGLFGIASLVVASTPVIPDQFSVFGHETSVSLLMRLLGAAAVVWAAWAGPRTWTAPRAGPLLLGSHVLSALLVSGLVAAFASILSLEAQPSIPAAPAGGPFAVDSHPILAGGQLVLTILYAIAAVGFARPSASHHEGLEAALPVGFALFGAAQLNFLFYPSPSMSVVHMGDYLRLLGCLALLVGAGREIQSYWTRLSQAAVAEERRRTARELHDGLVQDLAFIRSRTSAVAEDGMDQETAELVAMAAERAYRESRLVITALTAPNHVDTLAAVRLAAEEVGVRGGVEVELDAPASLRLPARVNEELARIVREACWNGIRHGRAQRIVVQLSGANGSSVRLKVTDDGCGFDPSLITNGGGFGLMSMRERAGNLGGELYVVSKPGCGATVEVRLPRA